MDKKQYDNLCRPAKLKWLEESVRVLMEAKHEDFNRKDVQDAISSISKTGAPDLILDYYEKISGLPWPSFLCEDEKIVRRGEIDFDTAIKGNSTVQFLGVGYNTWEYDTGAGIYGNPEPRKFIRYCYADMMNEELPRDYREMLKGVVFYEGLKLAYCLEGYSDDGACAELENELYPKAKEYYSKPVDYVDEGVYKRDYLGNYLCLALAATIALRDELAHTIFGYAYGRPFLMIRQDEPA